MWKVSCFYEKVHDLTNFGGYAAILISLHTMSVAMVELVQHMILLLMILSSF